MKRLEKNQKITLSEVAKRGGRWKAGDWTFGTNHRTENILSGLVHIGLAEKQGEHKDFGVYALTPKGLELAATL